MKKVLLISTCFLLAVIAIISCKKDSSGNGTPAPTITSIAPTSASQGSDITITGTNLSGATVKIGGVTATVKTAGSTSIVVTVPTGVALGSQAVVVTTGGGSDSENITIVTPPAGAPTIASIAPTSAAIGDDITITGTNLTGATVKIGGVTATVKTPGATSVVVTVPAGVALGAQAVAITTTGGTVSENITIVEPAPASSNLVAADKLAAYWPLRTDSKETKSNIAAAKTIGTTFAGTDGPFGSYANFADGYLVYDPIPVLNQGNSLDQFSVSMWVKIANNNKDKYPATNGRYTSLFSLNSTQIGGVYGPYTLSLHTNQDRPVDEFAFGAVLRHIDNHNFAYGESTAINADHIDDSTYAVKTIAGAGNGSKWIHVVQTFYGYSPNPRPLVTYINGEKVDEHLLYGLVWPGENFNPKPGGADSKVTFGTFQFQEDFPNGPWGVPPHAGNDAPYWAHGITGGISDVRFYKEPINDADVSHLYTLGLQGK